jgi:hypothetical protein
MSTYNPGQVETFASDGSYTLSSPVNSTTTWTQPASCFLSASACSDQGQGTATCSLGTNGDCACAYTNPVAITSRGRYSITGTKLSISINGTTSPVVTDYCAKGGSLVLSDTAGEAPSITTYVKQ